MGLSISRLRTPALRATAVERYRRMEISLEEALIAMRFLGLSTGKMTDVAEMLRDLPLSSSTQSRPNKKACRRLGKWGMGPTSPAIPYPRLEGIVMKARVAGGIRKRAPFGGRWRESRRSRGGLGYRSGFRGDGGSWLAHLRRLKQRGPEYVGLAVPDARLGIGEALAECFPRPTGDAAPSASAAISSPSAPGARGGRDEVFIIDRDETSAPGARGGRSPPP
ncbi:MAG: transposase [Actinomycetota bacterium]